MAAVFGGARSKWPTALGVVPYSALPAALTEMSQLHAHRAIARVGTSDPLELIDQAFSVGAAVELLLKATLASVDIHLIRDLRVTVTAAANLSGLRWKPALPPLPDIRTLGPADAVKLLASLTEIGFTAQSDLTAIATARDSAVHMGLVDSKANEQAVGHMVKLIAWTLHARHALGQDGDPTTYWADHAAQAEKILTARNDEIFTEYERKLLAATARYNRLISTESGRNAVAYLEEGEEPPAVHEIIRDTQCPACKSRGRTVYDLVVLAPPSASDDDGGFAITGRPRHFYCGVCKLALTGDDLEAALLTDEVQPNRSEMSRDGFIDWVVFSEPEEDPTL